MDVSPIIIAIWSGAAACMLAGGALSAWAAFSRRPRARAERSDATRMDPDACCPCCGYSSRGLESDTCPECGQSMAGALAVCHLRKRIAAGTLGALLVLASAAGPLADHAHRIGWVNAAPTNVLLMIAEHVPPARQRVLHALAGRADAGTISSSDQRQLSDVIERLFCQETRPDVRREAAALLKSIAKDMGDTCAAAALRDRDPVVRQHGVQAIMRSTQAERVVTTALLRVVEMDRNDRVRREAVEALRVRGLHDPRRGPALQAALDDVSPSVQIRAMYAIGDAREVSLNVVLAVVTKLLAGDEHIREAAAWTIARISSRNGVDLEQTLSMLRPMEIEHDHAYMKSLDVPESWEVEWSALPGPLARTM